MSVMAKRKKKSQKPQKPLAVREEWSRKLKALRDKLGLSQFQAADTAGVQLRTWISWENRQHVPNAFVQESLHKVFPDLE